MAGSHTPPHIGGQGNAKTLNRYLDEPFDYVITVCDDANEACPFFPGAANRLHWSFEDPSRVEGSEEERLAVFRSGRDRIRERIEDDLVATDEVMPTS
jgi:arsenate reductase